jgi:hypothetical protein
MLQQASIHILGIEKQTEMEPCGHGIHSWGDADRFGSGFSTRNSQKFVFLHRISSGSDGHSLSGTPSLCRLLSPISIGRLVTL